MLEALASYAVGVTTLVGLALGWLTVQRGRPDVTDAADGDSPGESRCFGCTWTDGDAACKERDES